MLAVDTNVFVHAADVDSPFHAPCRDGLNRQRARPAAWYREFVTALLASPGLGVLVPTEGHADVAGEVISKLPHLAGNAFPILYFADPFQRGADKLFKSVAWSPLRRIDRLHGV